MTSARAVKPTRAARRSEVSCRMGSRRSSGQEEPEATSFFAIAMTRAAPSAAAANPAVARAGATRRSGPAFGQPLDLGHHLLFHDEVGRVEEPEGEKAAGDPRAAVRPGSGPGTAFRRRRSARGRRCPISSASWTWPGATKEHLPAGVSFLLLEEPEHDSRGLTLRMKSLASRTCHSGRTSRVLWISARIRFSSQE